MTNETEEQERVPEDKAWYGVNKYSSLELEFHKDIMKLLKSNKYKNLSADGVMVVFGRCYSVYCLSYLKQQGLLNFDKKK